MVSVHEPEYNVSNFAYAFSPPCHTKLNGTSDAFGVFTPLLHSLFWICVLEFAASQLQLALLQVHVHILFIDLCRVTGISFEICPNRVTRSCLNDGEIAFLQMCQQCWKEKQCVGIATWRKSSRDMDIIPSEPLEADFVSSDFVSCDPWREGFKTSPRYLVRELWSLRMLHVVKTVP